MLNLFFIFYFFNLHQSFNQEIVIPPQSQLFQNNYIDNFFLDLLNYSGLIGFMIGVNNLNHLENHLDSCHIY